MLDISVALFAKNNRFKCYAEGIRQNTKFFGSNNTRVYVDDFALNEELGQKKIYFSTNNKLLWTAYKIINYEVGVLNIDADIIIDEEYFKPVNECLTKVITQSKNKKVLVVGGQSPTLGGLRRELNKKLFEHFKLPDVTVSPTFNFFYTNSQEYLSAYKSLPLDIDYYYRVLLGKSTPKSSADRDFNFETTVATVREEDIGLAMAKKMNLTVITVDTINRHDRRTDSDEAFMSKNVDFITNNFSGETYNSVVKEFENRHANNSSPPIILTS